MKKLLLVLIIALSAAVATKAEVRYNSHVSVGAKAGVSLSKMSFTPSVPQKMLMGGVMGVSFRYAEERHVGLQVELNLSQRGWKEDFLETGYEYSHTLTYISVPMLTHIFFGTPRVIGFFNLGPEVGYMIGHKRSANFDIYNYFNDPDFPVVNRTLEQLSMEITNRFDYGITAGGGCEFYLTPRQSIFFEARYYFGIGNIFPDSKKDYFGASRGWSILLTAGFNFRLK